MIHRCYSLGLRLSYLLALLAHDATESEALTDHREPLSRNRALSPITCVVLSDIIRNDILLSRCRYCWVRSKTQEDRSLPTLVNICPDDIFWTTIPAMTGVGVGAFTMTTPPSQRGAAAKTRL